MFFDTDNACVPYLSDHYIDSMCNDMIRRFDESVFTSPHPVNIELFIKKALHLNIRYARLSADSNILGVNVFRETDRMPVYSEKSRRAEYVHADEGDIFIENELTLLGRSGRLRFTLAHEAGHALWHRMYFIARSNSLRRIASIGCGHEDIGVCPERETLGRMSREELIEYQANKTASCLLMPRDAVNALFKDRPAPETRDDICDMILLTAGTFRVSDVAARYRLMDLGLISRDCFQSKKAV